MYIVFILSIMTISYEMGILTPIKQKHPVIYRIPAYFSPILEDIEEEDVILDNVSNDSKGQYVASKNGTKYYFTWCSGVSRIKEENKIYFDKKELAEAKGLEPSKTCPGL